MLLTLPAAKCVVIIGEEEILKNEKSPSSKSSSVQKDTGVLALILTMPDGKEIHLMLKSCERGQVQVQVPDEG